MDIEKNQIHALFDEFYKAVIPEMRPLHIYKYDYEGQKRFWFERFREAFFSEQPSLKNQSYTELPVMWLAGFRNKASAVPETKKRIGGYYIQDLRSPIGNCMKFWYKSGYGTKHAKFFWCETYEQAKQYQGGCDWFKIWYAPYIDTLVEHTVDMQLANRDQEKVMIKAAQDQS